MESLLRSRSSVNYRDLALDEVLDELEDVKQANGGYTALCPAHDDNNPSLSIRGCPDGRVLLYCHAGCEFGDIIHEILERRRESPNSLLLKTERSNNQAAKKANYRAHALILWQEARPAARTLVQTYLRERRITIPPPLDLRFHTHLEHPNGWSSPGMVAAVRNIKGEITAIHRTFFLPHLKTDKRMLGPVKGGAVRLAPVVKRIAVAEGIETALSFMQAMKLSTWAALSERHLAAVELPDEVVEVIIAADGDDPGRRAAEELGLRLIREGRVARIAQAPDGKDFNDVLRGADEEANT